jgi:hypothetical protein
MLFREWRLRKIHLPRARLVRLATGSAMASGLALTTLLVIAGLSNRTVAEKAPAPIPADTFLDSIGMNVHMAYFWTSYRDEKLVHRSLDYLGIRHLRDVFIAWDVARPKFEYMAGAGMHFDFVIPVDEQRVDVPTFVKNLVSLERKFPGSVSAIEGPNEINIWPVRSGDLTGLAAGAQIQKDIYAGVRAEPSLNHVPIYNLTHVFTDEKPFRELGAMQPPADFANAHTYMWSWGTPTDSLEYLLKFADLVTPGKPMVDTETGYTTMQSDPYSGVDEAAQAVRVVQTLLHAFMLNVKRTYLYELLDQKPDPAFTDAQQHFGIFRHDGTPKPAATAIRNLINVLKQPDGKNYANAGAASVSIENPAGKFGKSMLFQRADGARCLVLWLESPTSDKERRPVKEVVKKWRLTFDKERAVSVVSVLDGKVEAPKAAGGVLDLDIGNGPVAVVFGAD